jgi:hypothetical protein
VALIALTVALVVTAKAKPPKPAKGEPPSLAAKLIDLARERPAIAAGAATVAAAAAVTLALKNPKILTAIIAGLFAPPPPPKR